MVKRLLISSNSATLPNTKWQHITLTMPDILREFSGIIDTI